MHSTTLLKGSKRQNVWRTQEFSLYNAITLILLTFRGIGNVVETLNVFLPVAFYTCRLKFLSVFNFENTVHFTTDSTAKIS